MVIIYLTVAAGVFLYLLYRYSTFTYTFWADHKVPFVPPLPFFGSTLKRVFGNESAASGQQKKYEFFGDAKFGGDFIFRQPSVFIKDPELIEQILIKDFSVFYNRSLNRDPKLNPLSRNLLNLENSQWKTLRNKLTPAFSSSKMKILHQGLVECCQDLTDHLSSYADTGEPFEVKKTMSRFVVYSIGTLAFGLKLNTLKDPDCKFAKMAESSFRLSFIGGLLAVLSLQFPWLAGRLQTAVKKVQHWIGYGQDYNIFFMNVIKDTTDYREKNNIQRNDFLQILMELRKQDLDKNDEIKFDLEVMTANAFVFLVAGYDTNASTISFLLCELSKNEDIQERLLEEILEVLKKYDGVPTYEALKEMKYLDQVLAETLRMYPPIPATFRISRSPYQIPGTSIVLPAGTNASIPIYSLHHDPKYFPDPEKFDPARFADEARTINGTYIPFGDGPRICIGKRLAILEVKLAVIKMLLSYKFTFNEKTQTPFKFARNSFFLNPVGGIWLNISRRLSQK